jgi:subtilase family serine protease
MLKTFFAKIALTVPLVVLSLFVSLSFTFTVVASPATTIIPTAKQVKSGFSRVCGAATVGHATCLALVSNTAIAAPEALQPNANPTGGSAPYTPSNLHSAYNLPNTASGTQTVAIVDAYNDPNAESDLATYRSHFGLSSCTTANGCFRKVSQTGGTKYPSNNTGWSEEISLDLDMVSAICQNCHIILVEASSTSFTNLGTAVNEAVALGATQVSNSYGSSGEVSGESSYCSSYYTHNDVAVTVSSGDGGPTVDFPAVCPHTVSVGGTSLNTDGSETAWNTSSTEGAGGGCSSQIAKPSWESSSITGCSNRAVADVSAVADPATGVAVYDSYGVSGWLQFGGTSVSSPIIAAVYALAGNASSTTDPASLLWNNRTSGCLFGVPSSSTAYAYQTGLGTPDGIGCF